MVGDQKNNPNYMIIPMEYTHLGHDFLDQASTFVKHSGVDLNYGKPYDDLNKPVKSMARGQVVFSKDTGKGWGNLVVIYHAAYGVWSRYGHLEKRWVQELDKVEEGQEIGLCGATGGNWTPHCHWDVIIKKLPTWTKYTTYWDVNKILEYYRNPLDYVAKQNEIDKLDEPIVKWHKDNGIITKWSSPPTPDELKLGWGVYKGLKAYKEKDLEFNVK